MALALKRYAKIDKVFQSWQTFLDFLIEGYGSQIFVWKIRHLSLLLSVTSFHLNLDSFHRLWFIATLELIQNLGQVCFFFFFIIPVVIYSNLLADEQYFKGSTVKKVNIKYKELGWDLSFHCCIGHIIMVFYAWRLTKYLSECSFKSEVIWTRIK